jgi:hypothetical protein
MVQLAPSAGSKLHHFLYRTIHKLIGMHSVPARQAWCLLITVSLQDRCPLITVSLQDRCPLIICFLPCIMPIVEGGATNTLRCTHTIYCNLEAFYVHTLSNTANCFNFSLTEREVGPFSTTSYPLPLPQTSLQNTAYRWTCIILGPVC